MCSLHFKPAKNLNFGLFSCALNKPENRVKWRGSRVSMKCLNHLIDRPSITQGCTWIVVSLCLCLSIIGAVAESEHAGLSLIGRTFVIAVLKDIVMIPVRSTPWDSEKELDELYDVFLLVKDKWKTDVSSTVCFFFYYYSFHSFTTFKCPHNDVSFVWMWYWLYSYILLQKKNSIFDFLILSECNHPGWF